MAVCGVGVWGGELKRCSRLGGPDHSFAGQSYEAGRFVEHHPTGDGKSCVSNGFRLGNGSVMAARAYLMDMAPRVELTPCVEAGFDASYEIQW